MELLPILLVFICHSVDILHQALKLVLADTELHKIGLQTEIESLTWSQVIELQNGF